MRSIEELLTERASRGDARGADAVFDAAEASSSDAPVVPLRRRRPIAPLAVAAAVLAIVASVSVTAFWGDDESPSEDVAIGTDDGAPAEGDQIAVMEIPALGITADVIEGIALRDTMPGGVGHDPATALPGEDGRVVLLAPGPCVEGVFAGLGQLSTGDRINFTVARGEAAYRVHQVDSVEQSDGVRFAAGGDEQLVLVACDADDPSRMVAVEAGLVSAPPPDDEVAMEAGDLTALLGEATDDVVVLDDGYGTVTMLAPEDRLGVRWDVTAGLSTQPLDWQQVRVERLGDDLVVGWDGGVHLVPLDGGDSVLLGEATTFAVADEADGVWLLSDRREVPSSDTGQTVVYDAQWEATLVTPDGEELATVEEPILGSAELGFSEAEERALVEADAGIPDVDLSRLDITVSSFDLHEVLAAGDGLVVSTDGWLGYVDAEGNVTVLRSAFRVEDDLIFPDGSPVDVLDARDDRVLWCEGDYRCSFLHLADVVAVTDDELAEDAGGWAGGVFSPDGSTLAAVPERGLLVLFVDENGNETARTNVGSRWPAGERTVIDWDPDGEAVYVTTESHGASTTPLARFGTDGSVHVADLPFGRIDGDIVVLDRDAVGDLDELPACSEGGSAARCSFPLE